MTYPEVLQYLYDSLPMYQRIGKAAIKKDLTNTLALCQHVNNPQDKFRSVHIAGTNGKGSSAHSLAAILQSAGYKTGLYTSPHLKDFTERIRINGMAISQEAVIAFVTNNRDMLENVKPSFFEMTVAMSFDYFAKEQVDIAVIEVGLGGRLDSTNVITPLISLITNIGYDHTDMLGDTLAQIAYEKAGIIKANVPVVISERQEETTPVFIETAQRQHAPLYFAQDYVRVEATDENKVSVYEDGEMMFENISLALTGTYQVNNLSGVLQTVALLQQQGWGIDRQAIISGLASVDMLTGLKGRWQTLAQQPLTICDTGHNREAFIYITKQLKTIPYRQLHMVLGFSGDKDIQPVLELLPRQAHYYFCQAQVPRAMPVDVLKEKARRMHLQGEAFPTVEAAIHQAQQQAGADDLIFIGGSNFVVAEIKEL